MPREEGFDSAAAVTRSLLGWGVIAGIFYLVIGITQGLLREGFSFSEHALSLLMLGDSGWVQQANLILTGLMVIAAALGFYRALMPDRKARGVAILLTVVGLGLVGSGVFPPDPVDGFPDPSSVAGATTGGILHLDFGALQFIALAAAAFSMAGWFKERQESRRAGLSRLAGVVIVLGFLAGAALATSTAGVALLWMVVLTGWFWLGASSLYLYRTVPHPDLDKRVQQSQPT